MNLFIDGIAYDGVNGRLALKLPSLPPLELNVERIITKTAGQRISHPESHSRVG